MIRDKAIACLWLFGAAAWLSACEGKKPAQRKETLVARRVTKPANPPARPEKPVPVAPSQVAPPAASPAAADTAWVLAQALGTQMQGYQIESIIRGNLDADRTPDFVVVLRATKPEDERGAVPGGFSRRVALVLNHGYPRLALAAHNDNVIECTDCGGMGVGDPNQGVTIHYPDLVFESLYGAWQKSAITVTFRHSRRQHNWLLHDVRIYTYSPSEKSREKVLTARDFGRITFTRADGPSFMLH